MKQTFLVKIEKKINSIIKKEFNIKIDKIVVDKTKNINNGDFYTNAAMILSGKIKKPLKEIFDILEFSLKKENIFEKIVLINGFINFYISSKAKYEILNEAKLLKKDYGQFDDKNIWYNIEFVSANPTGSLHIGHARNAALGMTLANVWKKFGIRVDTEYYVNDGGSQINKLGLSVFVRYLQELGVKAKMEEDWYQGEEPKMVAKEIVKLYKDKYKKYEYNSEKILNKRVFDFFRNYSKLALLDFIKKDLNDFGIKFKKYYFESSIYDKGLVPITIKKLGKNVYEKDGATWLGTSKYGDDKDRVIVKSNKELTYFMPDIAYHNIKLSRGYNKIFNIFGADHSTYVTSLKSAIGCLGHDTNKLHVLIMQMVKLTKNGQEFKMSKRTGQSLTLRDLIDTIGVESARWSLISQAADSHLEIDIDSFDGKTHDNHLFYVFYTYARINKIISKFNKMKIKNASSADKLVLPLERELINMIYYYPHTIQNISEYYEIHKLPTFLLNLCTLFNSYYNDVKILNNDDVDIISQRILMLEGIKSTIISGLSLMNIKTKNKI